MMNKKELKRLIKYCVEYGIGYMAVKHNIKISKKERDIISNEAIKKLQTKK